MNETDPYSVQHLFLLVGKNPLPVFVSAWRQVRPGGSVYLLHTGITAHIAAQIQDALIGPGGVRVIDNKPEIRVVLQAIDSVNPVAIENAIGGLISDSKNALQPSSSVGLNYTGGTKPMALHAHRKISQCFQHPYFYYLDADTLRLHWADKTYGCIGSEDVRDQKRVNLDQMAALQEGKIIQRVATPTIHSQDCIDVLVQLLQKSKNIQQWKKWREMNLDWTHDNQWILRDIRKADGWTLCNRPMPDQAPLSQVTQALTRAETTATLGEAAMKLGLQPGELSDWLSGKWLEQYIWQSLQAIRGAAQLHDVYTNVIVDYPKILKNQATDKPMELDVVAIRGMQLFVFSCTVGNATGTNKQKLFEVFSRARLLGGDEARLAVVSTVENPKVVESQLKEGWQTNQIKVFGREELPCLSARLQEWIEDVNKNTSS